MDVFTHGNTVGFLYPLSCTVTKLVRRFAGQFQYVHRSKLEVDTYL